jgi:tRNA-Thr(GGU) m(6)t(6)A37 methyltransferase TsaA
MSRPGAGAGEIRYQPIGVARTPFRETAGMPIQPRGAGDTPGSIEIRPELAPGLRDLEGFSHIFVLYHFHRAGPMRLEVRPFLDAATHGVFATRAPVRPNPIGLSVVRLTAVRGNVLEVAGIDLLDGTPVLDIKPYVPEFDCFEPERLGWLAGRRHRTGEQRADERFGDPAG